MPGYLNFIDWTAIDWSLVISVIALLISLYTANLYWTELTFIKRQHQLEQKKYDEEKEEKERQKLDIVTWRSNRWGGTYDEPLRWIGVWLKINNKSDEQPFLNDVVIKLHFKIMSHENLYENRWDSFISNLLKTPRNIIFEFSLYDDEVLYYFDSDLLPDPDILPDRVEYLSEYFFLMNWETKKPIFLFPQKEFRMQPPKEKGVWFLFGNIPLTFGKNLINEELSFDKIEITFNTDQDEITLSDKIHNKLTNRRNLNEYLKLKSLFSKPKAKRS